MFHIPELTDQVIDHLHADADALRTCALVCRSWVPASQYHIFFSVNIKQDSTCRLLCDMIAHSPHIGRYIRNIYVYFEVARPPFSSLVDLQVAEPRRLSIVNCPHTEELALLRHLICHPSLTDIRFFSGTSVSRAQLDFVAQTRPGKLGSLLLYSASDTPAPEDGSWISKPDIRPLDISALNIGGDPTLVTDTLIDPHGPINLQDIDALTFDAIDISCLRKLLAICGQAIVVLEVLVSTDRIDIGHTTIPYLVDLLIYDITALNLPSVLNLVTQLGDTSSLRHLRLADPTLHTPSPSAFAPTPENLALWSAIDRVLDTMSGLVSLELDGAWSMEPPHRAQFLECFANMVRKKILRVQPYKADRGSAASISTIFGT